MRLSDLGAVRPRSASGYIRVGGNGSCLPGHLQRAVNPLLLEDAAAFPAEVDDVIGLLVRLARRAGQMMTEPQVRCGMPICPSLSRSFRPRRDNADAVRGHRSTLRSTPALQHNRPTVARASAAENILCLCREYGSRHAGGGFPWPWR